MPKFPPELIKRLQDYCLSRFDEQITSEQAELYLDSLGSLFLTVYRGRTSQSATPSGGTDGRPP